MHHCIDINIEDVILYKEIIIIIQTFDFFFPYIDLFFFFVSNVSHMEMEKPKTVLV